MRTADREWQFGWLIRTGFDFQADIGGQILTTIAPTSALNLVIADGNTVIQFSASGFAKVLRHAFNDADFFASVEYTF